MKLLFRNSKGKERLVAEVEDESHAFKKMNEFCDEHNFKIWYVRRMGCLDTDGIRYDVGSWTEGFRLIR